MSEFLLLKWILGCLILIASMVFFILCTIINDGNVKIDLLRKIHKILKTWPDRETKVREENEEIFP